MNCIEVYTLKTMAKKPGRSEPSWPVCVCVCAGALWHCKRINWKYKISKHEPLGHDSNEMKLIPRCVPALEVKFHLDYDAMHREWDGCDTCECVRGPSASVRVLIN